LKRDLEASKNYEIFLKDRIHQGESILLETGIIAIVELKKNSSQNDTFEISGKLFNIKMISKNSEKDT
jgi:hypothetical protein